MRRAYHTIWILRCLCLLLFLFGPLVMEAQPKAYTIKDGKMFIQLSKNIRESELDSFILNFELEELDLKWFLKTGRADSLVKLGWDININNETGIIISKGLFALDNLINPGNKININKNETNFAERFPAVSNAVRFGYNQFKNKPVFAARDSIVTFFLRGHSDASKVMLAGSFNDWSPTALAMTRTDTGWIADVKLGAGKYWYKFISDGRWMVDNDNTRRENDGQGNTNSVFFKTNTLFTLDGFSNAKRVFLAGSFNNWKAKDLAMNRTATGWELPLYLADGTHSYKFVVDGKWYADEKNPVKMADGAGGFNSVISMGSSHVFRLQGYENAKQVILAGSFNSWRDFELHMNKTENGWELPYVIGPGNYEYKFKVDGKWISDPANPIIVRDGNSYLIKEPNYTFRLKGYPNARKVYLAGDFNSWSPDGLAMKKEGDDWVFSLHLSSGKVRYKFVVDGHWILDPSNKQWEQNEHNSGNSIIWIED